jgi:hypothetical protein
LNDLAAITFTVPSSRANYRYFRWLLANEPRLLLRFTFSQARFLVQLLRRLGRLPVSGWREEAAQAQSAELEALAARFGLGETLRAVDALKATGADAVQAAGSLVRQAVKTALGVAVAGLLVLSVFSAASMAIGALQAGVGWKALLSVLLCLVFVVPTLVGLVAAALRMPRDGPPPVVLLEEDRRDLRGPAELAP